MAERNFDGEFTEIMIAEAARDSHLTGVCEYMIHGHTDLVDAGYLDEVDLISLMSSIEVMYALTEDQARQALEKCERRVLDEAGSVYQEQWDSEQA